MRSLRAGCAKGCRSPDSMSSKRRRHRPMMAGSHWDRRGSRSSPFHKLSLEPSPTERVMCLAIPARVIELLPAAQGVIELGGVRKRISLELVDGIAVGDYVIVHVGY